MRIPNGWELKETIHTGRFTWIARARDAATGASVLLKGLRAEFPTAAAVGVIRHEYAALRQAGVRVTRAVAPLTLAGDAGHPVLVFPDLGGSALSSFLTGEPLPLPEALRIVAGAALALEEVHAAGIIHRDVKPSNILVGCADPDVRLIDFGAASAISRVVLDGAAPDRVIGTLPYIAPEQTGRLGRAVDARADLYALGATFFQLVTGRLPFESDDPLALIHAHIALMPPDPCALQPGLPRTIGDMILTLLAKSPDDRYQTSGGVAHDLAICLDRLQRGVSLDGIELRRQDLSDRFALPTGFYGRAAELAALRAAFERAAAGSLGLVLVRGFSGSGKTALVQAMRPEVYGHGGICISGKHDAVQRMTPYAALRDALGDLVGQLLALPESQLALRCGALREALGPNLDLALEFVPPLCQIFGRRPPETAAELDRNTEAARLRFERTLLDLLRGAASQANPLLVFVDDLQWADPGTLQILRLLAREPSMPGLLIVGAWRSNEVDARHPLSVLTSQLTLASDATTDADQIVTLIEVEGLDDSALSLLVGATLHREPTEVADVAALISRKTAGNPFFARLFLQRLHDVGILRFNRAWAWDAEALRSTPMTDNVAEMMAARLGEWPPETVRAMAVAAALGARFGLGDLAETLGQPLEAVWRALWPPVHVGMLLAAGTVAAELTPGPELAVRFLHDRVQQTAYATLPEAERATLHARITAYLRTKPAAEAPTLFALADHALLAIPALLDPTARQDVGRLLVQAGRAACAAAAYAPALTFLGVGLDLCGVGLSKAERFAALVDRYVCESLTGAREGAEARFAELMNEAQGELERAQVQNLRIGLMVSQGLHVEAIGLAREALAALGQKLPGEANLVAVIVEVTLLKLALRGRTSEAVATLPAATDLKQIMVLRIINTVICSTYFTSTNLFTVYSLRMCRHTLRHGATEHASFAWSCFALVVGPILGDYPASAAFSKASRALYRRFSSIEVLPRLSLNLDGLVDPWSEAPSGCIPRLEEGVRAGHHAGDPLYAAFCANQITYLRLLSGSHLDELAKDSRAYEAFGRRHGIAESPETFVVTRLFAEALSGPGPIRTTLLPDAAADAAWVEMLRGFQKIPIHIHRIVTAFLHLLAGRPADAVAVAREAAVWTQFGVSTGYSSLQPFTLALGLLMQAKPGDRAAIRAAKKSVKAIRVWSVANPAGFAHRTALLEAEVARIEGRDGSALAGYENAVTLASRGGFAHDEGLACLRTAAFAAASGNERVAGLYRRGALAAWERWGAVALVRQLQAEFPELAAEQGPIGDLTATQIGRSISTSSSNQSSLDLTTVLRAAEALTREIRLESLIGKLLALLIESAGAQRALLFLMRDGVLRVEGELAAGGPPTLLQGQAAEERADVAHAMVRYVQRTRARAILGVEILAESDPYLARGVVRSCMAVPVITGGVLQGVLYLENPLVENAFSGKRAALLEALSGQIGVSIQNAQLYREQSELATAFRRFVPEEFLQFLGHRDIRTVQLGDAVEREMAVLFADLRGFTSFSESRTPTEVFEYLNRYLLATGPLIRVNGGFVDKYIGDAMMALYPADPAKAVKTAVDIQRAVVDVNTRQGTDLRVGIGIHVGRLALGVIGELERRETTVIGDAVNTAARLESLTKHLGVDILVSAAVRDRLPPGTLTRHLGAFGLAGRTQSVEVHEVLDHHPRVVAASLRANEDVLRHGLEARNGGRHAEALAAAQEALTRCPQDGTALALRDWASSPLARAF